MARTRIDDAQGRDAVASAFAAAGADRATMRLAVKYTLQLLADRAPGHSVEVRIPPYAAVQAIPGPVHRRGTPSAVVEMDATTWLGLATGRIGFSEALATGRVRASGHRADLSDWLPVLPLR